MQLNSERQATVRQLTVSLDQHSFLSCAFHL